MDPDHAAGKVPRVWFLLLAGALLMVPLSLAPFVLTDPPRQILGVGAALTLRRPPDTVYLIAYITNVHQVPVLLQQVDLVIEAPNSPNKASSSANQIFGTVTDFSISAFGRNDTMLPNTVTTIQYEIPLSATRAMVRTRYSFSSGKMRSVASKLLLKLGLKQNSRTRIWLDQHGFYGTYWGVQQGQWISERTIPQTQPIGSLARPEEHK